MIGRIDGDAAGSTQVHRSKLAHVIVVANEKGGSGKSTIAVHIAIALLRVGYRVATIDLDSKQKTLTHFVDHRCGWAQRRHFEIGKHLDIEIPDHYCVSEAEGIRRDANEVADRDALIKVVSSVEYANNFLVIDTPPSDTYLMWLALGMADTLVTPLNDSFVDFDVLGSIDPVTYTLIEPSDYARMVCNERRERRKFDRSEIDWIVMLNRYSNLRSQRRDELTHALKDLGLQLGFRCAEALTERVVYRELFPRGLTVLDEVDDPTLGKRHGRSRRNAQQEVQSLIKALKLSLDEKSQRHAIARAEWYSACDTRKKLDDMVGIIPNGSGAVRT